MYIYTQKKIHYFNTSFLSLSLRFTSHMNAHSLSFPLTTVKGRKKSQTLISKYVDNIQSLTLMGIATFPLALPPLLQLLFRNLCIPFSISFSFLGSFHFSIYFASPSIYCASDLGFAKINSYWIFVHYNNGGQQ